MIILKITKRNMMPLKTTKGITKKELVDYLLSRKDIPDYAELNLNFNNDLFFENDDMSDRKFRLSFLWDDFGACAEHVVEFDTTDSEQVIKNVFRLSI
jgi:hypothetical protein